MRRLLYFKVKLFFFHHPPPPPPPFSPLTVDCSMIGPLRLSLADLDKKFNTKKRECGDLTEQLRQAQRKINILEADKDHLRRGQSGGVRHIAPTPQAPTTRPRRSKTTHASLTLPTRANTLPTALGPAARQQALLIDAERERSNVTATPDRPRRRDDRRGGRGGRGGGEEGNTTRLSRGKNDDVELAKMRREADGFRVELEAINGRGADRGDVPPTLREL